MQSIEWILNYCIPKNKLGDSNMKPLPRPLRHQDVICTAIVFTLIDGQFQEVPMQIYPNMIVKGTDFLILSSCSLEKDSIIYGDFSAHGLILHNWKGQTYLYFQYTATLLEWTRLIKRFCKLKNFLHKFTLKEKSSLNGTFACVKNKTGKVYTVRVYALNDLQYQYDYVMNEVNIMMSFKHPTLLQYCFIYEDALNMYVLYDYWVGEPISQILAADIKLQEQHVSQIAYQIFQCLSLLHQQHVYHGALTLDNLVLLRNHIHQDELRVVIINFSYREDQQLAIYKSRVPAQYVPQQYPHFKNIDQLQLGLSLFAMLTNSRDLSHEQILESKQISQSQREFLLSLTNPNPHLRKQFSQLMHHQWFINVNAKQKIKFQLLPSLKTILEIMEITSQDQVMASQHVQVSIQTYTESSDEDEQTDYLDRICNEENQVSKYIDQLNSSALTIKMRRAST